MKTRTITIALILILVSVAGCVDENASARYEDKIKEEGYILDQIAPNIIIVEIEVKWQEGIDPFLCMKEALKEIATTHTIQDCVPIKERRSGGDNRIHGEVTGLIVFVEPKEISVP